MKLQIKNKDIHVTIFSLTIVFCFMIFIYAPLEVFLTNTKEFWFGIEHIWSILLIVFLLSIIFIVGVLELLLYFMKKKHKELFNIFLLAFFAVFLMMYIQGNYIPRNYGVLDGRDIDWGAFKYYAAASIIIFVCVVVLSIVILLKLKKYFYKIIQSISLLVFIMLFVAGVGLFFKADRLTSKSSFVITDKDEFVVSKNKNVIVIVLDTFDTNYMNVLLKENKEKYSAILKDFTYYKNSIGGYPTTSAAMPLIYTGQWYENNIPFDDFIKNSFESAILYKHLRKDNYSIGIYSNNSVYEKENFFTNVLTGKYVVDNPKGLAKTLCKVVLFNYTPHQLKHLFVVYTDDFDVYKETIDIDESLSVINNRDEYFYDYLITKGLEIVDDCNAFRLIHLKGMHPPYTFGENVVSDGLDHDCIDAAKGCICEVDKYLNELRKNGVYDNSAIFIMADHGGGRMASYINSTPLLLVKRFNESHDFEISNAPISLQDIYYTLDAIVTGDESAEYAVWNIKEENRNRRFIYYDWDDSWSDYLPVMTEYFVNGDIVESNFMPSGNIFVPNSLESKHKKGLALNGRSFVEIPIDNRNSDFKNLYVSGLEKIKKDSDGLKWANSKGYFTKFKIHSQGKQPYPYKFIVNFKKIELFEITKKYYPIYATVNGKRQEITIDDNTLSFYIPQNTFDSNDAEIMIFYPHSENVVFSGILLQEIQHSSREMD